MPTDHIIAALEAQRDRLTQAIDALRSSSGPRRRGRKPGRHLSAAARKRIGQAKKAWWAKKRKG